MLRLSERNANIFADCNASDNNIDFVKGVPLGQAFTSEGVHVYKSTITKSRSLARFAFRNPRGVNRTPSPFGDSLYKQRESSASRDLVMQNSRWGILLIKNWGALRLPKFYYFQRLPHSPRCSFVYDSSAEMLPSPNLTEFASIDSATTLTSSMRGDTYVFFIFLYYYFSCYVFLTEEQKDKRLQNADTRETWQRVRCNARCAFLFNRFNETAHKLLACSSLNLFYYRVRAIGLMFLCTYV